MNNGTKPSVIWPWSPGAVRSFMNAATKGGGRFHVPAGLDAALLYDLTDLSIALTRFRIDLLTGDAIKPRNLNLTNPVEVSVPITRKLLLDLLAIPELPEEKDG